MPYRGWHQSRVLLRQDAHRILPTEAALPAASTLGRQRPGLGAFTVVASDQSRRDEQFQDRIMQTSQYPTAAFTLHEPVDLAELATTAGTHTLDVQGTLALHGTTKNVSVPLTLVHSGATLTISGQVPVIFADYRIDNPSFSFAKTHDHGTIEVLLHLAKA
jgi:hypothetical protein